MAKLVSCSFAFLSEVFGNRVLAASVDPLAQTLTLLVETGDEGCEGIAPSHGARMIAEDYPHWIKGKTEEAVQAKIRWILGGCNG